MARSKDILQNLHGVIGPVIVKQYGDKIVVTARPRKKRKKKKSKKQKEINSNFDRAVKYAQDIIYDAIKKAAYAKTIKRGASVYHAAISEYLNKHKV